MTGAGSLGGPLARPGAAVPGTESFLIQWIWLRAVCLILLRPGEGGAGLVRNGRPPSPGWRKKSAARYENAASQHVQARSRERGGQRLVLEGVKAYAAEQHPGRRHNGAELPLDCAEQATRSLVTAETQRGSVGLLLAVPDDVRARCGSDHSAGAKAWKKIGNVPRVPRATSIRAMVRAVRVSMGRRR